MRIEDARRKIRLLSLVKIENGASAAEAENAKRIAKTLMQRYTIKAEKARPAPEPAPQLTWVYWQELFNEYALPFSHFGHRGSATLGYDRTIYIELSTGQWRVEKRSSGRSSIMVRDRGVESLRKYLHEHATRSYSLFKP